MDIGRRLFELRETKGMSQGDIEEKSGLLRCYISRTENGPTVPAIETLEKMARASDMPLYALLYDGNKLPERKKPKVPPMIGLHKSKANASLRNSAVRWPRCRILTANFS